MLRTSAVFVGYFKYFQMKTFSLSTSIVIVKFLVLFLSENCFQALVFKNTYWSK